MILSSLSLSALCFHRCQYVPTVLHIGVYERIPMGLLPTLSSLMNLSVYDPLTKETKQIDWRPAG
jgi:hypothetical protein